MRKPVYIYALREDGSDDIRYVGQTVNPQERLQGHREDFVKRSNDSNPKRKWVTEVSKSGKAIVMDILEESNSDAASAREQHWIEHFSGLGCCLTNSISAPVGISAQCRMLSVRLTGRDDESLKLLSSVFPGQSQSEIVRTLLDNERQRIDDEELVMFAIMCLVGAENVDIPDLKERLRRLRSKWKESGNE